MTKLVLTRKSGESILVGDQVLKLAYVGGDQVKLELDGIAERVNVGAEMQIAPGVSVKVASIQFRNVRFVFDAPREVAIVRTELIGRERS